MTKIEKLIELLEKAELENKDVYSFDGRTKEGKLLETVIVIKETDYKIHL